MTSKRNDKIAAALISRKSLPGALITLGEAVNEIAATLNIPYQAAEMTLYGLCVTGGVRWSPVGGEVVELDEITADDFSNKPALIEADDIRSQLTEWSPQPQRSRRDQVISGLLAEGLNPPRNVDWKSFCDRVRDKCNGWLKPGKPAHGFSDKQIQRVVKELTSK
jgi:hypothetical protein